MIDVHPTHHGSFTLRDFFTHLGIVVLGILIAIGLEQSVEYLHHRHLANEAYSALLAERQQNETANEFNIFTTRHHQVDLMHDLAILHALGTHKPLPQSPFITRHIRYLYLEDEWRKIHQSGTVNYLAGNLGPIDYRYQNQEFFTERFDRSTEDLHRAASVLRNEHESPQTFEQNLDLTSFTRRLAATHESLPQQEVDAAWATFAEPGDVAALSPAQIDALERALQIALADDDDMLTYCYNIKRNLKNNPVQ